MRYKVIEAFYKQKLLPIFNHSDIDFCKHIIRACYDGGQRLLEYTNRGNFAHEVFAELSKYVKGEFPDLFFGAGTIIDAPTAALYLQMGADFIVSPILNEEMAKVCNRRKVLWVPGCGTLSEISKAEELGAEIVKAFPADTMGGAEFIKAIKGPSPWTNILVTGGAKPEKENLEKLFGAGAACVGMGSKLFTKEVMENKNYGELTRIIKKAREILDKL